MVKALYTSFIKIIFISVLLSFLYYNSIKPAYNQFKQIATTQSQSQKNPETINVSLETRILKLFAEQAEGKDIKEKLHKSLLDEKRLSIKNELKNYTFHSSLNTKDASDLIIESGGSPIRSLIVTTWRSRSTFLGDIIQSHPGTYYIYEPFMGLSRRRIKEPKLPSANEAINILENLYSCNYSNLKEYLQQRKSEPNLIQLNKYQNQICQSLNNDTHLCVDQQLYSKLCGLVPFQLIKTVKLQMKVLERKLMEGRFQDLKIIYLVQDPRETMFSRWKTRWCRRIRDCIFPENLCNDLVDDYITINRLRQIFPHQIMVIRFEDLSQDLENQFEKIFDFLRLSFTSTTRNRVYSHSERTKGKAQSTLKISKEYASLWTRKMTWARVLQIQKVCAKAMSLWGYVLANDTKNLARFNAVKNLSFE